MTPPVHPSRGRRLRGSLRLWLGHALVMGPVRFLGGWALRGERPDRVDPVALGTMISCSYAGTGSLA